MGAALIRFVRSTQVFTSRGLPTVGHFAGRLFQPTPMGCDFDLSSWTLRCPARAKGISGPIDQMNQYKFSGQYKDQRNTSIIQIPHAWSLLTFSCPELQCLGDVLGLDSLAERQVRNGPRHA